MKNMSKKIKEQLKKSKKQAKEEKEELVVVDKLPINNKGIVKINLDPSLHEKLRG